VILERLYPPESIGIDSLDRDALLASYAPTSASWVRINMIASINGSAVGSDGTSTSLSSAVDRRILGVIREQADVVLIGAHSFRTEGYLQPRAARLAVVTQSGDLTGHDIRSDSAPLVLCPPSASARVAATCAAAEILELPEPLTPLGMLAALNTLGLRSVVCEGGPRLAAQFVDAAQVDEICLTTSPSLGGRAVPVLGDTDLTAHDATLTHLLRDESGYLFARWSLTRQQTSKETA
jgi:riboflavin biosynthesis pyrimidine reductase